MGYRVGYQCFISSEAAHDYILSQQLPTITSDGRLMRPIKEGANWYFNGNSIHLTFPECDIATQIAFGAALSAPFILLAVMVFGFRLAMNLIHSVGAGDDD